MKLFIWRNVLRLPRPGVAYAMAHDADEAKRLILDALRRDLKARSLPEDRIEDVVFEELRDDLDSTKYEVHETAFGGYMEGSDDF